MADKTGISWTDATWNPIRGCSRASEGCRNCYAERVAARFSGKGHPYEGLAITRPPMPGERAGRPSWTGEVRLIPEHLADPLRWKKPRRIFVNSMSDLFHEKLTNEQIAAVFGVMAAAPRHTFQVLTKRAKRMREWFAWACKVECVIQGMETEAIRSSLHHAACDASPEIAKLTAGKWCGFYWPLPNVWLGVSVEDQAAADERIPELLATPAAVRFLSCEPLLGPVELTAECIEERANGGTALDWVIAGCESGPGARPCGVEWLRSLRDQCARSGVAFFLKQATERPPIRGVCTSNGPIAIGRNSKAKGGGVVELPYLDGVQHAAFPEVAHG